MSAIDMATVLPAWGPGQPMTHRSLTLVPLVGGTPRYHDYLLACEAIGRGLLEVTEVSDSGTVPELLAINRGEAPVLLVDGEELRGAKQNRILNTSVLLEPTSETRIPVSCVEQGRWSHVSRSFSPGHHAPSSLRKMKSRHVHDNLRRKGRPESDQGAVWDCVADQLSDGCVGSPTQAMSDAMESRRETLADYRRALPCPEGACGVVAAGRGRFMALDAFDSAETMAVVWDRLVESYAVDAETTSRPRRRMHMSEFGQRAKARNHDDTKDDGPPPPGAFTENAAMMVLETLAEQHAQGFDSVGLGQDLRFESDGLYGQALEVEGNLLHLSAFPPTDDHRRRPPHPRFRPPSQRGR